ncbi:cupin domain-containing protein [Halomonas halodenitrificans]|uniref:cupin domain-containing protein n=1 Tax=Halomonas halodenitrificans TaxID=28252 RepID=UPI0006857019|nr:cupin domain-containing protein [Halomonas halodenitrificans]
MTLHIARHPLLALGALLVITAAPSSWAQEQAIARTANASSLEWGGCPAFMPDGCEIAVLHGEPAEPNVDIFYRVPGKAEVARHWHNSPERMVLVSGEMEVTYDGQEPVMLNPGTYAHGPARKPHSVTCRSEEACTLFIAFIDPLDAFNEFDIRDMANDNAAE